jgi:hypothetical protein
MGSGAFVFHETQNVPVFPFLTLILLLGCPTLYVVYLRRVHQTLRVTPAMEASVADHVWSVEEIASLAG